MPLSGVDERLARGVRTAGARLGVDVGQCARDDVDDHRPGVAVPGELRAGLNRVLDDDGSGRLLDVDDHGPLAVELDLELEIHVVGQDGAAGQRLGRDRRRRLLRCRDADYRSGGEDEDSGADGERRPLPWGAPPRALLYSSLNETASTTRRGSRLARCATSAAALPDGASKVKKQSSSSGTYVEPSKRTRVPFPRQLLRARTRSPFAGGPLPRRCRGRGTSRRGSSARSRRYEALNRLKSREPRNFDRAQEAGSYTRASSVRVRTPSLA